MLELKDEYVNETKLNAYLGRRLCFIRKTLKISQQELADLIGVTFQQIQKYEKGANKISVSRLYCICQALNISLSYFLAEIDAVKQTNFFQSNESLELIKNYYKIKNRKIAENIFDIIQDVAKSSQKK